MATPLAGLTLRAKVLWLMIISCAAALLLACAALTYWQYELGREADLDRNVELSHVIASNVAAALLFSDRTAAAETAQSLSKIEAVRAVRILDTRGQLFAGLNAGGDTALPGRSRLDPRRETTQIAGDHVRIVVPVRLGADHLGWVELVVANEPIAVMLGRSLSLSSLVFFAAVGFAVVISRRLDRAVFHSFDGLVDTMDSLRRAPDYSVRVNRPREPDVAGIIDGFNLMLAEMEQRDAALAQTLDDLGRARDAAEAANVAKSQFLSNMSHELRTPLNAIIAYADLVREDLEEQGGGRMLEDVNIVRNSAHHLLALINDILDFAKIEAGRTVLDLHRFDLAELVREVGQILDPLARARGNCLTIDVGDDVGDVVLDSVKLKQCLLNLGSNAVKFTEGGHVVIAARAGPDGSLQITVADSGIGMTPAQIDQLFQPFIQADASTTRRFGGTGLGLAITRRFVELMGGRIDVSSSEGLGTTFTITLLEPEATPLAAAVKQAARANDMPVALVIDDEPTARDILRRWLQPLGYDVQFAENGASGLERAAALQPDIILLDIGMPELDGWEVLKALRADPVLRTIPTVVVTVDDRRRLGLELGACEYVNKPVDREHLLSIIETYRNGAGGRVLLAEDDAATAAAYTRGLIQAGFEVVHAADGAAAIAELEADPQFDIVVSDLMMPLVDGFGLVEMIRSRPATRAIPIMILTAKDINRQDYQRLDGKAERLLPKAGLSSRQMIGEMLRLQPGLSRQSAKEDAHVP